MTSPNFTVPEGAQGLGTLNALRSYTEEHVRNVINQPFLDSFGDFWGELISTVGGWIVTGVQTVQRIVNQIVDIFNGVIITPINDLIQGVKDWFHGIFQPNKGGAAEAQKKELAGLQSTTQDLLGVIGYGHAYSTAGISLSLGSVKYGMTNTIGKPNVGVAWTDGSVFLGSKGLWMADAQVTLDSYGAVGTVELVIKVFKPDGSLHFEKHSRTSTGEIVTLAVHMPFTVDSAGYYVELWVNAAFGRGIFGGSAWNGLSVNKISMEKD